MGEIRETIPLTRTKQESLVFPVAFVVLLGWVASLAAGIYTNQYTPLTITTPAMLMLAGYVFGVNIIKRNNGNH